MDWNTLLSYGAELALTDVQMAALKNIYDKTKDSLLPACLAVWHNKGEMELIKQALPDEMEQNQFLLLLHIAALPFGKECHKAYPAAMFQEIKADTAIWVRKMEKDHDCPCLTPRIYGWCHDVFTTRVKQFGRLQCNSIDSYACKNIIYRRSDGSGIDIVSGTTPDPSKGVPALSYGDNVINVHIPEAGPMYPKDIIASMRAMAAFSREYQKDYDFKAFVYYSWLLDPVFQKLLPETSNILALQRMGHLFMMPDGPDETLEVIWRLWGHKEMQAGPAAAMSFERRTSMQKNVSEYLANGGKFMEAVMVIFPDELEKL